MPEDGSEEPRGGVFSRIYARHARRGDTPREGPHKRRERNGRDRARGREPQDEHDAEQRMRADTMIAALRQKFEDHEETAQALRKRIAQLPQAIKALDGLLRDSLTKANDGMWGVPDRLTGELDAVVAQAPALVGELDELEETGSLDQDLLSLLTRLEIKVEALDAEYDEVDTGIEELEEAIQVAQRELQSPRVKKALAWGESFEALQLVPNIRDQLHELGDALGEGYPVDLASIERFCDAMEAYQKNVIAARSALATLKVERDNHLPAAQASWNWFQQSTQCAPAGAVFDALHRVSGAALDTLTPPLMQAAARQAIQRDIDALKAWSVAIESGLRKGPYTKDILDACAQDQPFYQDPDTKTPPPYATTGAMAKAMVSAVCELPVDAAAIQQVLAQAKACPGRWRYYIKKDDDYVKEQAAANARALAIAALSTHLQNDAGWRLAAGDANTLATRMLGAHADALAKLQASGLRRATWNRLAAYVGDVFDSTGDIFDAIDTLGTEAKLSALATQRLPYLELTEFNLDTILATGAARISDERYYPFPSDAKPGDRVAIGASVVIEWNGWMPGNVKAHAWGAVHLHFRGTTVTSRFTKAHIKDYEDHVAGGVEHFDIERNSAGAQAALAAIRARDFKL